MNYQKHYHRLIDRAQNRLLEGYQEKHHIIPKCLGGDDSPENIVSLTPEEHYVAHQLLVKMYPSNHKLIFAARMMTVESKNHRIRPNKLYGWLKRKHAKAVSRLHSGKTGWNKGRPMSDETKRKLSEAAKGRTPWNKGLKNTFSHTQETRNKIAEAGRGREPWNKGIPATEEHRKNNSIAQKNAKGWERSEAKSRGETTYLSSKPCKHGHISPRWTHTGNCIRCSEKKVKA